MDELEVQITSVPTWTGQEYLVAVRTHMGNRKALRVGEGHPLWETLNSGKGIGTIVPRAWVI